MGAHSKINIDTALKNLIHETIRYYMPKASWNKLPKLASNKLKFTAPHNQEAVEIQLSERLKDIIHTYDVEVSIIHDGEHKGFSRIFITVNYI